MPHLPGHMDSVRQSIRPKHQVLILKCYPRLPKNSAVEAKPNGSELSYLLYYVSTRRSKLQKVGGFLERKTAADVSHSQSARILVTLLILSALLENKTVGAGSGFALIAPYVLRIIHDILRHTNDVSLIEASNQTWHVLCQRQDQSLLAADHEYRGLYEEVVRCWASYADRQSSKKLGGSLQSMAVQDQIRLRHASLEALKSLLVSDNLIGESGKQLQIAIPAILSNLQAGDGARITRLVTRLTQRIEEDEKKERIALRRQSTTISRGVSEAPDDVDPRQAEGTALDADMIAEEEIAVLALACIQKAFSTDNRGQLRLSTDAVLKYLGDNIRQERPTTGGKPSANALNISWATKLFELCIAWTPVQDRFVILVTAVETMLRLSLSEPSLRLHLLYADLIDHILRSDLNLIGLSVMDILFGIVQQILRILHLCTPLASEAHFQKAHNDTVAPDVASSEPKDDTKEHYASDARVRLTQRLRDCIADLATHIYYTDQVSDMVIAILARLKPDPNPQVVQNPVMTSAAIEEPKIAVTDVASNTSSLARARSNSINNFFSFETARCVALEIVRDIMRVANSAQSLSSSGIAESRNRVTISVWDGTQWLLRDPYPPVRRHFVDALTTWLALETRPAEFRIQEPQPKAKKSNGAAKRAVSSAGNKSRGDSKVATSTFLQLLHLAVYDVVLDCAANSEHDIVLVHLLLHTLVRKLGVNAVRAGLPVICALQDDVASMESPLAEIRASSVVHGYFWTLVDVFNLDISIVGREILGEINRRKQHGLWLDSIGVPAGSLEQVPLPTETNGSAAVPAAKIELQRFEDRKRLVESISDAYAASTVAPLTSPPRSPGRESVRHLSTARTERAPSSYLGMQMPGSGITTLPDVVKDDMLALWTREGCLAAIAAAEPKAISLSGSRSSPAQGLLAGASQQTPAGTSNTTDVRNPSITQSVQRASAPYRQQAFGSRLQSRSPGRNRSAGGSTRGGDSSSLGGKGVLHVDELKRLLVSGASGNIALTSGIFSAANPDDDTGSESMVELEDGDLRSENGSFISQPQHNHVENAFAIPATVPENASTAATNAGAERSTFDLPPVLSLLADTVTGGRMSTASNATTAQGPNTNASVRPTSQPAPPAPPSREGRASMRSKATRTPSRKNLRALLDAVAVDGDGDVKDDGAFIGLGRPPY